MGLQFVLADCFSSAMQGLGVPSFSHFLKLGEKKTPQLSQTFNRQQSVQLSSGRLAKVTL